MHSRSDAASVSAVAMVEAVYHANKQSGVVSVPGASGKVWEIPSVSRVFVTTTLTGRSYLMLTNTSGYVLLPVSEEDLTQLKGMLPEVTTQASQEQSQRQPQPQRQHQ